MNCPTCKLIWTRLDICPTLPIHDCSKFQGENPPAKSPRAIILEYLAAHGPTETVLLTRDLSNSEIMGGRGTICPKTLGATLQELKAAGEIVLSADCKSYSLANSK